MSNAILLFCLSLALLLSPMLAKANKQVPRFELDAQNIPIDVPSTYRSTRGYLVVYEDPLANSSRTVRLPVIVVHAKHKREGNTPVLYVSGGPGTSALNAAAYPDAYPWLAEHDFVVVGQRGTQFADPALECPGYGELLSLSTTSLQAEQQETALITAALSCRESLIAKGISLNAYHTAAIAADLEALRQVLDYKQWNLYAVSYGTRVAMSMMRDNPESVRSAVLDSVLLSHSDFDNQSAANFLVSIEKVLVACSQNKDCKRSFPNLKVRLFTRLRELVNSPITIKINNKFEPFSAADLLSLVDLSSVSGIASAPFLLDAIARADKAIIIQNIRPYYSSFAWGMRLSVWCAEARDNKRQDQDSNFGLTSAAIPLAVCNAWQVPLRTIRERSPLISDIPTLLIAGEYDPVTPAKWAKLAAETLTNSRVMVIPFEGHGPTQNWSGSGCAMSLAVKFFDNAKNILTMPSNETCLGTIRPPEFLLNEE